MTTTTENQRRAYSAVELAHGDHMVLDREHWNAPKDEYGDPEGI
jgi:hypothetical protein